MTNGQFVTQQLAAWAEFPELKQQQKLGMYKGRAAGAAFAADNAQQAFALFGVEPSDNGVDLEAVGVCEVILSRAAGDFCPMNSYTYWFIIGFGEGLAAFGKLGGIRLGRAIWFMLSNAGYGPVFDKPGFDGTAIAG